MWLKSGEEGCSLRGVLREGIEVERCVLGLRGVVSSKRPEPGEEEAEMSLADDGGVELEGHK